MAELTVANYLASLQDDPWDQVAFQGLNDVIASGDQTRLGKDPVRLLEFARRNHEVRGESLAAAKLMEGEIALVGSDPDFAAVLYRELGRIRRDELMDDTGAREAYTKSLELRPGDEEVQRTLEQMEQVGARFQEIADHFIEQAKTATDATLKTSLLVRAATILWQHKKKGKNKDVDRLFKEALHTDPTSARAARLYELTLRERGKWKELGETLTAAAEHVTGRDERLGILLATARVLAKQLEDPAKATTYYERVLELLPAHEEALGFLVAHFTEQKQWDHLVALYEDALRARQLKSDAEHGILLQIAMVHWKMLGRPDRAEPYFARVRKADPAQPVMLDFYREQYSAMGEPTKLVAILSDAQRRAATDEDKVRLSLEIARVAQNDPQAAERAIDAFKLVLRHDPGHAESLSSLKQLYRKSGKWNALVELLRAELDALKDGEREAKLRLLNELLAIYRDELKLEASVLSTYNAILQLDPGNHEAAEQLSKTYESMGRYNDLIPVLSREAEVEADPKRKVALYLRVGKLWIEHFSNYNQATQPLEQVLALDPDNREALVRLREIYAKKRAWKQLAQVLAKEADLSDDESQQKNLLSELAVLSGERLHEYPEAIALWKRLLALEPGSARALDALEKLAERAKDWDTLAETLEHRAELADDLQGKIRVLTRVGTLHNERTLDPARSAAAWKRVLALDPKNGRALRTLREAYLAAGDFDAVEALYAEANDWEGFVDVLGAAADRTSDPERKKMLSFRAAEIYEKKLSEPARAFRSYERVLGVQPDNERAVRALLPLYEKDEKWPKVAQLLDILLKGASEKGGDESEQLALLTRLTDVTLTRLRDGERAFGLALRGYQLAPLSGDVRTRLEQAAEQAGLFEKLAQTYVARADASSGEEATWLRRRVAQIAAERLKRPDEAALQLEKILTTQPDDREAQDILERIYRTTSRHKELDALFQRKLTHAKDDDQRVVILTTLASLEENELSDRGAAIERVKALRVLRKDDRAVLGELDRLLTLEKRAQELLEVVQARVALAEQNKERAELTLRIGGLGLDELKDLTLAQLAFSEVLEIDPNEARAVAALERIAREEPGQALEIGRVLEPVYERTFALDKLSDLLKARLAATKDTAEKRLLKLRLSELSSSMGDPKSAYATLESAFLDSPQNPELWDKLSHAAERAGTFEELAVAFSTVVEMGALSAEETAELSARTARVYDQVLGNPEKAEPFHERVLAHDPLADNAYQALRELYTNRDRWEELKKLYRTRITASIDPQQKLELLLQVCFLFEEILDDVDMAIRSYCEVLELDPHHSTSRRALERLYTRAQRFSDLVSLLEGDRADVEGKEAIELSYRIGDLYEHKLAEPARAVDQYAEVLVEQPTHLRAQEALGRLLAEPRQRQRVAGLLEPVYTQQGAHVELARVLEVQLEELKEAGPRVSVLLRLGGLYERELRDVDAAFRALSRAVEADAADESARTEFERVATLAGKSTERAALLEAVLSRSEDARVKTALLRELSYLWDVLVADPVRAIDAYARLIASDPDEADTVLPAARSLERLHTVAEDFPNLAEDLRKQIDFETDIEIKKGLLARLADLCEHQLDSVPRAIAAWSERLGLDQSDVTALLALERLHQGQGQWEELISILEKRDAAAQDQDEARSLCRRIGEIYETKLKDSDGATLAYEEVITRFGNDRETIKALARVYEATEQWSELLETVQTELSLTVDALDRAQVRFRAAELMRVRTLATEAALDAYRAVLEDQPGHEGTIRALNEIVAARGTTRLEAARILVPHYDAAADHDHLIRMLEVIAESEDGSERLDALRRAADVAERKRLEAGRAYALMAKAATAALQSSELAAVLDDLHRLAQLSTRFPAYGQLLSELAPEVSDEDVAITLLTRAAENARDRLSDRSLAREYYEKVLALRPEHEASLSALEALHEQTGDHRGLLAVLRKKTELAADVRARTKLLLRQAELSAGPLDDVGAAIGAYESVLEETQTPEVFAGLEQLYQRAGRHAELSAMYERQLDLEVGDPVLTRYRLAELWRKHLDNPERALDLYEAVLERSPVHEDTTRALEVMLDQGLHAARAAELLEPVYLRRSKWPELTRSLEAQLANESSPERKKELLGRLGQLHEVQLEDLEAALETYARLFRVDPSDVHAWDTLGRLARVLGRQLRVAEVYEEYLEEVGVDDELSVRLSVSAAQIRDQIGHDLARAGKLYQRAVNFNPAALPIANALEDVLVRRRDSEELRNFYRAQADAATDENRRVHCLHRLGQVTENELREHAAAIRIYQEILEVAAGDEPAIRELDRLLTEAGRYTDLAEHIGYQIGLAGDGTLEESQLKLRLARLYEERLDDVSLAVDAYEDILRAKPSHPEARAALERLCARPELLRRAADILAPLYERAGEWEKQIWLAEKLVGSETDVAERSQLYGQIARLYEERGQNLQSSMAAWRRALCTDPADDHARSELVRIASALEDWDGLVQAFEEAIETTVDNAVKASLLGQVAEAHDQRRGDPRAAIAAYERLIQVDTEDTAPLAQLESLLTMVGDWQGLVSLYKRKVERAYDPVERAELWRRAGSVLDDLLADPEGAIRVYNAAIEEVSDDEIALSALDDLYQRSENYQALADILRRRVDLLTDTSERLDANLRLGATLAEKLSRVREAIDAYERALEDDPASLAALVPLSGLYESESMWAELLDSLRRQLELVKDQSTRLSLLYRIGQVLDERLSEPDDAIESYRQVLELDGTHEPTIKALFRLGEQVEYRTRVEEILEPNLRAAARWDELATLLTRGISALPDAFDKQRRHLALAQIHEQHRNDKQAAFDALCAAHLEDAEDTSVAPEIERLAGQLGAWERAAEVIDRRAASTSDPQMARALYRRLARIAEQELKDVTQTIEANEQALERSGDDDELLSELTRLYTETRRFDDLAEVLERRVALVDVTTATELLLRLGEIRLREFDDARAALSAYRDVLERQPGEPRAVKALEGLLGNSDLAPDVIELLDEVYRKAGELGRVAELYEVRLKLTDSAGERVTLLTELANLWEREGNDLDKAGKALRRAFEADATDYGLLDEVERVANASGHFEVLRGLVETATRVPNIGSIDSRDLWMRAAGWYGAQLADSAQAEQAYRSALGADPDYEPAHEGLSTLLRAAGKNSELVTALVAWADRESDRGVAVERLLEAARVAEQGGELERAVSCYERALSQDENCVEALDRLIHAHESQGRVGKVVQLYERRIALEDGTGARVAMRHKAAAIRRAQLDDEQGAIRLYRANLDDQPDDLSSLDALEQLYVQSERWDEVVRVLEQRLEVASGPNDRATARVRLAGVSERQLKNASRAIDELREIVLEVPTHPEANAALERLLESEGRWSDLVEQLERKIDQLLATGDTTSASAAQVQSAQIIELRLADPVRAQEVYEALIERDPANVTALRALARLYGRAGDPERAASTLESLLERVEGDERVTLAYELAELAERELSSRERAEVALRLALAAPVRQSETREKLFALSERHADYQGLAQLLSEEAEISSDAAQKVQLLRRASELARVQLKDPSAAAAFLERAVGFAPEDRTVLVPLCELYIAAGRQSDAVPVLQRIIASYGGRRVKEVAGFHHMLARAFAGMGDNPRALTELDAAYRVDLTNVAVLKDLGLMAYEQGDYDRAQKTFRGLLLQRLDRDAPISKADVYYYLGEISRQQGDSQKAISMLERAVAEQASHERAKTLLSSLKG
jgi:tetratricopeptide (TPR) repeat protein